MQRNFSEKYLIIILCLIILLYIHISSIDNVGIIILFIPILLILLDIFVLKSPKIEASEKKYIIEEENIEPEKEDISDIENITSSQLESKFKTKKSSLLLKIISLILLGLLLWVLSKSSTSVTF